MLRRLITAACLLLFVIASAKAQKTIYVLSDTHVMAPQLLASSGSAWDDYLATQRKLLDYSSQLFETVVNDIKNAKPDLLLITGDLTKDGEVESHQFVKTYLDELRDMGIGVYVIPGNHDVGNQSGAMRFDGDEATPVPTFTKADFKAFYSDYGYASERQDPNSLSYACEPIPGLWLIGIDSGTNGVVSEATIDWVCQQAADGRNRGLMPVAMMHHALVPHVTNADMFLATFVVNQKKTGEQSYESVKKRFIEAGIKVILTGHFHVTDIAVDYNSDDTEGEPIYDISTGSIISYPCDYRVLTLSDDISTMDVATSSITTLSGVDNFQKMAEDRLHTSIKNMAYNKIDNMAKAKLGETLYAIYNFVRYSNLLSTLIADAYIEHSEGNEDQNLKAKLITKTELDANFGAASLLGVSGMDDIKDMIHSMLENKSPYGTGRENVTNDRSLTIEGLENWDGVTLALFDAMDNSQMLEEWDGVRCNVLLYGRKYAKNGYWNTLCLPFDLKAEDMVGTQLGNATIAQLHSATLVGNDISFEFERVADIEAGKPYIIKWGTPEENPQNSRQYFSRVKISNELKPLSFGPLGMTGNFSPSVMIPNDKTVRFVGSQNYIYYPTDASPVKSFRSYFTLDESIASSVKRFSMDVDETTGVVEISAEDNQDDKWFDVSGREVTGTPTQKGVYVRSNRKYVIK